MMKNFAAISITGLMLFSCQSTEVNVEERVSNPVSLETEEAGTVIPTRIATIEVSGMTCVKGCGGSIRKSLKKSPGVSRVTFDFDADRVVDVATVYFDNNIVSVDEISKMLSKIDNNKFTVGEVEVSEMTQTSTTTTESSTNNEESKVDVCNSSFEFPNLLDLFSGILTIG